MILYLEISHDNLEASKIMSSVSPTKIGIIIPSFVASCAANIGSDAPALAIATLGALPIRARFKKSAGQIGSAPLINLLLLFKSCTLLRNHVIF